MKKTPTSFPPTSPPRPPHKHEQAGSCYMANSTPSSRPFGEMCITLMIEKAPLTFHRMFLYSQPSSEKGSGERRERRPVSKYAMDSCFKDQGVPGPPTHQGPDMNNPT